MARRRRECSLDDEIMQELHAYQMSDAPSDCESVVMMILTLSVTKRQERGRLEVSDSDVNSEDEEDVDDGWTKNDDLRNLKQFLGNTGLTLTPDDPTRISEVVNQFIWNNFLEILVKQSNLYRTHAPRRDPVGDCQAL
jgi:hypothetical protein